MELATIWFKDGPVGCGWRTLLIVREQDEKAVLFDFSFLNSFTVPKSILRKAKKEELNKRRMIRLIMERERLLGVCGTKFDRKSTQQVLQELRGSGTKPKIAREVLEEKNDSLTSQSCTA